MSERYDTSSQVAEAARRAAEEAEKQRQAQAQRVASCVGEVAVGAVY